MKTILLQWDDVWQAYFIAPNKNLKWIQANSLSDIVELIPLNSKEIYVLMEEKYCIFGSLDIHTHQQNPYDIKQWKIAISQLKIDLEKLHQCTINEFVIECVGAIVNGQKKDHILGEKGNIEATLLLFGLLPSGYQLIQSLGQQNISYNIYPRSFFMLHHLFTTKNGLLIILHKSKIEVICFTNNRYEVIQELNTGATDLYRLFEIHGFSLKEISGSLTHIQQQVMRECIETFFEPIVKWILSISKSNKQWFFLSDIINQDVIHEEIMNVMKEYSDAFMLALPSLQGKKVYKSIVDYYIYPLLNAG